MKDNYSKYNDSELFVLLKGKKEESERAFSEIYSRYSQRIFAYCLRMIGNHDDAKDVFQDTFLKFYHSVHIKECIENIPAYIITIARNNCYNHRKNARITVRIEDFDIPVNDNNMDQKEALRIISSALDALDMESREVFILRQYHGMSCNDISLIVGDTAAALKSRVWRAKEKLKEILTPYLSEITN